MTPKNMAIMWLRQRAESLRASAQDSSQAYQGAGALDVACGFVSERYRKAAALLDEAADEVEDQWELILQSRKRGADIGNGDL